MLVHAPKKKLHFKSNCFFFQTQFAPSIYLIHTTSCIAFQLRSTAAIQIANLLHRRPIFYCRFQWVNPVHCRSTMRQRWVNSTGREHIVRGSVPFYMRDIFFWPSLISVWPVTDKLTYLFLTCSSDALCRPLPASVRRTSHGICVYRILAADKSFINSVYDGLRHRRLEGILSSVVVNSWVIF